MGGGTSRGMMEKEFSVGELARGEAMVGNRVRNGGRVEEIVEADSRIVRTMTRIKIRNHEGREEDAISENIYLIERENGKPSVRILAGVNYREGTKEYEECAELIEGRRWQKIILK